MLKETNRFRNKTKKKNSKLVATIFLIFLLILTTKITATKLDGSTYDTITNLPGAADTQIDSTNYRTDVTMGQTFIGNLSSTNYGISTGFFFSSDQQLPPKQVPLTTPTNGNDTSITRAQVFTWQEAVDPNGDLLTYDINITRITFTGEPTCSVNSITQDEIEALTYTSADLCVDDWYEWKVRAYDGQEYGQYSEIWNFSIQSYNAISLINSSVDFGTMLGGENSNTSSNSPYPLVIQNDGNIKVNTTIYANQSLWIRSYAQLNTSYFQYKADETAEGNTFDTPTSQTTWTNVSDSQINLINQLKYADARDTAEIDLLINVPEDEPGGSKITAMVITSIMS